MGTKAYQRLRGVKHLGLASLVFPGADYSRFAHGIGTCHVTGQILNSLTDNSPEEATDLDADAEVLYRMAALLHDVGHYPFSHTLERAIKNHYSETTLLVEPSDEEGEADQDGSTIWLHEEVGQHVIDEDEELGNILDAAGIDRPELSRIIRRVDPPRFSNLVSSDLDADRIDYLMRTALHTGLPYGRVDLDYLLTQIRLDGASRICFDPRGMRAAEHLLLCRYFDYQQVSFHKTVQALEQVLNDAVGVLLKSEELDCTPSGLSELMKSGMWSTFDDAFVLAKMRAAFMSDQTSDYDKRLLKAVLERRPPKTLVDREILADGGGRALYVSLEKLAKSKRAEWVERFDCHFWIWTQATQLTKIGSHVAASSLDADEPDSYDKLQQAVRIQSPDGSSHPIQEDKRSLISVLSERALYGVRVYCLIPPERESERESIRAAVDQDLGDFMK